MKKITFGLCLLAVQFTFAQQLNQELDSPETKSGKVVASPAMSSAKAAPFWTEDFGNGIPTSWAVVDSSGICPWTYTTDGSWGNFNGNNATAAGTGLLSSTANNGFIICDPDSANHFTYGQPSSSNYQYLSSYIVTSGIDCSGRSSVILTFEQYYRYNNGVSMNVLVSNDSINWVGYDVSGGLANNTASANADLVSLNITTTAANQPNVYIMIGWNARVYHWQVDDINLSEADPFDAQIGDNWWGTGQYQYQYYKIPLSQNGPVSFYSEISNNTGGQLDNVFSEVTVTNTGGVDFTGTSAQANLAAVQMDTFTVSTNWTPATLGKHDVDFSCTVSGQTDGNPNNNDFSDSVVITNTLYGMDNLSDPSQSTGSISNFSSNTGNAFRIGNVYEIMNDDGVQCIEIGIADDANNALKTVYGEVHAWDPVNSEWVQRGLTDIYELQSSDVGTIISLPLFAEAPVYAGEEMLVVAGHYGGAQDGSDDVSFMYGQPVRDRDVYGFDGVGDVFWLSNPRAIVCRAQFDCALSIEESENVIDLAVYPNPANDELFIDLTPGSEETVIQLLDMNGKVVYTEEHSVLTGQQNTLKLSTSSIEEGVYTLIISDGTKSAKERVVLLD